MKTFNTAITSLALGAALFTVACGDDKGETASATDATTTSPMTTPGTTTDETPTTTVAPVTTTDTLTTTVTPPTTTTDDTTTTTSPATTDDTTTGDDPFVFDDTPPGDLVQLDRMGMPAVATAVISAGMKDAYNEASPETDAMMVFVDDIVANVIGLHQALDDDLITLGFVPCAPGDCAMQAGPLVIPDVLKINTTMPAGFPNGRALADPVIDVTLSAVLLDWNEPGQDAASFAVLPLNPPANDKEFLADFPYIADPH